MRVDELVPVFVIPGSFVLIRESAEGLAYLLKKLFVFLLLSLGSFVGVVLQGLPLELLFDFLLRSVPGHAQHLVQAATRLAHL
jgi:hypothetical protein